MGEWDQNGSCVGWLGVEWTQLAHDRGLWRSVVSAVMNLRALEPQSQLHYWIWGKGGVRYLQIFPTGFSFFLSNPLTFMSCNCHIWVGTIYYKLFKKYREFTIGKLGCFIVPRLVYFLEFNKRYLMSRMGQEWVNGLARTATEGDTAHSLDTEIPVATFATLTLLDLLECNSVHHNPTRTALGLRGKKLVTNCLSYGTAHGQLSDPCIRLNKASV
jgi:hypothetical protein